VYPPLLSDLELQKAPLRRFPLPPFPPRPTHLVQDGPCWSLALSRRRLGFYVPSFQTTSSPDFFSCESCTSPFPFAPPLVRTASVSLDSRPDAPHQRQFFMERQNSPGLRLYPTRNDGFLLLIPPLFLFIRFRQPFFIS